MSSEGDSPSAPPFDTSDGHPADGTIVPVGEEPKYRLENGKILLPSLAYHLSTSSSSKNIESGSFEDEDEATALVCFSLEQDEDEEFDNDVAIFWPQTNITAVNVIENVISDQKLEVTRRRYFELVGAKIYKVGPYGDRPHHSRPNTFCFYEEYLKAGVRYHFHPFIVKVLNAIHMGLTQEQEAAEVRAATTRRLEALRERAEKASTSKGKMLVKESGRAPKRSKPSLASQKDMAGVSSIPRAQEESRTETRKGVLPLSTIHADDSERTPPRPKSGRSHKWARAEPSPREQIGPNDFSLAKVLA
ncbi:hypothetical protein O6P43_031778 [Quillaja saponaria]|uniref:Uncharacterized protein n=1 Tax=Quillaja saponaria TaxID=32244 RepID=A0AAD7KW44_QUISA|nr:hypothetical protein O6P43_031778 [Quillaja saponaria]